MPKPTNKKELFELADINDIIIIKLLEKILIIEN